jgi:signal transduction histidine kinase
VTRNLCNRLVLRLHRKRAPVNWCLPIAGVALAGIASGTYGESLYGQGGTSPLDVVRDVAVGWAFMGSGLVAWWRRPANSLGYLLIAEGFAWFVGNLQGLSVSILSGIGLWLAWLGHPIFAHLILAFPGGRLPSRWERLVVGMGYGIVLIVGFIRVATYDPTVACRDCVARLFGANSDTPNGLLIYGNEPLLVAAHRVFMIGLAAFSVIVLSVVFVRWRKTGGLARKALAPVWFSAIVFSVAAAWTVVRAFFYPPHILGSIYHWVEGIGLLAVPLAFLFGLLRMRLAEARVGQLIIEVGQAPPVGRLRDILSRTLKDPRLELAFWAPDSGEYVNLEGRSVQLPNDSSQRSVTLVEGQGQPLAALIHDPALADERELVQAVAAAVRLGLENERLHAQVRAQLEEVRASRFRIVEAADAERRRVERNLHDGAQQRLVSLSLTLRLAQTQLESAATPELQASLAQAAEELKLVLSELRELARGIHPEILTQQGLAGAVESLAQQAPVPVELALACQRYASMVETTAYFVICEALANVAKYAQASAAKVAIQQADEWLVVEINDDGVGGADPARGSGLSGLVDRVAALGGVLQVDSPLGRGTRVRAELPCG